MKQLGFPVQEFAKRSKRTRREQGLTEMEAAVPWARLCERIEPVYPKPDNGRKPLPLPTMPRVYFLQHCFNYSDEAMEEALYEVPLLTHFAGIDLGISGWL